MKSRGSNYRRMMRAIRPKTALTLWPDRLERLVWPQRLDPVEFELDELLDDESAEWLMRRDQNADRAARVSKRNDGEVRP